MTKVHDLREDVIENRMLTAGTVVHLNGLPVQLTAPVVAASSIANWLLIAKTVEVKPMH